MATSKVEICNMALGHLKHGTVSDIDSPSNSNERIMALWYDQSRKEVLRLIAWNFAIKRRKLAADAASPVFEFNTAYTLPSDFVRLLTVGTYGDVKQYRFEDDKLLISGTSSSTSQELPIKYIYDHKNVSRWDPLFIKVLALQIAVNASYHITGSNTVDQRLQKNLLVAKKEAYAVDGQENPPQRIQKSKYLSSRRGWRGAVNVGDRPDLVVFDDSSD